MFVGGIRTNGVVGSAARGGSSAAANTSNTSPARIPRSFNYVNIHFFLIVLELIMQLSGFPAKPSLHLRILPRPLCGLVLMAIINELVPKFYLHLQHFPSWIVV